MLLECVANRDSPTVANFSFFLHYTRATTRPLFPRPFLFFEPKISVWMGFSVCKKMFGFFTICYCRKPLGILMVVKYKKF